MPAPRHRPLRPCAALLVLAVAAGCSPRPAADDEAALHLLRRSVVRTLEARSARLEARIVPEAGATLLVEGVTSLVAPEAHVTATVVGDPSVPPAEVRVTAEGTWLRAPGATEWARVEAAAAPASPDRSWGDLLRSLASATSARGRPPALTARVDGRPVLVSLDRAGRITRVTRSRAGTTVELTLSDFGVEVAVGPP